MQRIIGIDFGTSTTYMNIKRYNGGQPLEDRFSYIPVVFNYGGSSGMVASIVRQNADGSFDFGEKAEEQLQGATIYKEVKMLLESGDEAQRTQARRITEEFFKFLYETYAQQAANLGSKDDEEDTIVSYPVKWQEETAEFMLEAARKAGFQNVRGMDEATAAVLALLCQNANSDIICAGKPGYLMLVDMGAGTTDLVICKYRLEESGEVHIRLVTSWPRTKAEPTFGGREIDAALEQYVEDYLTGALIPAMAPNAHVIATTPGQAKMWKEKNVSVNLGAGKIVNTCAYLSTYKTMGILMGEFPAFGRPEFEKIAQNGLQDYVRLLLGCLNDAAQKDAAFAESGLDLVILTGGHSAWYFAQEIVDGTMAGFLEHPALSLIRSQKQRVVRLPNPQTTVSLGLVYSKLPFAFADDSSDTQEQRAGEEDTPPAPEEVYADTSNQAALVPLVSLVAQYMDLYAGEIRPYLRNSGSRDLLRRLNVPQNAVVFLAHDDSTFKSGGSGFVVASTGIHYKGSLSSPSPCLSWQKFMSGQIRFVLPTMTHTLCLDTRAGSTEFATMVLPGNAAGSRDAQFQLKAFFEGLQSFLLQKSGNLGGAAETVQQTQQGTPAFIPTVEDVHPDQETAPDNVTTTLVPNHSYDSPHCGSCGAAIPTGAKYCPVCGQATYAKTHISYDPDKCPNCGAAIPAGAKKCPVCGRSKLRELTLPFKLNLVAWYMGETQFGIAKATGSLTILEDRIEYKKNLGNAAEMLIPYWNIYKIVKANTEPRAVYWMHDVVDVKEHTYGLGVPSIVLTIIDGTKHTFVAASASQANRDNFHCAAALISSMI